MTTDTTKPTGDVADDKFFENWFDPVETSPRAKVRGFIEDDDRGRTQYGAGAAALWAAAGIGGSG